MFFKRFLIIILLFSFSTAYCQYKISGNNDSRIKYRQIKTDKFNIVYPDYYEKNAQTIASVLDTVVPIIGNSLKTSAPNIPILIHTNSAISNGLCVWAPKRIEFWTTPSPQSYAFPYTWHLSIHEYRHAAQMQALNVGITKVLNNIFGEHILGAVVGIWIPDWFLEGDAVVAETALSPTGRGQQPEYNMFLKALIMDKGRYSVDKMLLGSMNDFVPDQYNLGYFLISHGRQKYGRDIWGDCLHHIGTSWWKFSGWGKTNNKQAKLDFTTMYNETIDSLEKTWADQDIEYFENNKTPILKHWGEKNTTDYINYKNPVQINDSTILALKTSDYQTQSLVMITNNKEKHLQSLPFLLHSYFQYSNGHILYSQYSPNIRWQQEATTDIIDFYLKENKFRTITSKTTFFTPIYYSDDSLIAAIYTDSLDNQNIAFIAPNTDYFKNKNILKKNKSSFIRILDNNENTTFSYPVWEDSTSYMYFIETSANGKDIIRYNVSTGERINLTIFSYDNIKYLKIYNNRLFFVKDVNNKYQLLSINLKNYDDVRIHTNSRYGIDNYFLYDTTIVVSDYTANGYKIVSLPYTEKQYDLKNTSTEMYFTRINKEQENFMLKEEILKKDTVFTSKKYSKWTHLFNFHSWAPLFIKVSSKELGTGVSAFSQNLLSSSVFEFGYKHNFHDKDELYAHYTYSGLYPIMQLTTSFKPRSLRKDLDSNKVNYIDWNEVTVGYNITLPFTWTNRNYRNNINLSFDYSLHSISNDKRKIRFDVFNSLGYYAKISNYSVMANNDLYPRTGHITTIKYSHTLTNRISEIFSLSSQIFVPSFWRNHSLVLTLSFQKNTPNVYYFPNEVNFVRGVYAIYPKYFKGFLSQYCFPFIYPNDGINGILYIKRVTAKPFYDFGFYDKEFYHSYGADIEAKIHVFRITIPINIGIRIGYSPTIDNHFSSFLFSLDL